jgi:hypothetical protein
MRRHTLLLLLAVATTAGCDDALAPNGTALGNEDAGMLAAEFDALGSAALDEILASPAVSFSRAATEGVAASSAPVPVNVTFNRTATCPGGGQATLSGTILGQRERETRTVETETSATKTLTDCAVLRRNGTTITSSGSVSLSAHHRTVDGAASGMQTRTHKGSFTYTTSAGASGSCEIDITSTFDPATHTRTLKGTTCRRTIDLTVTRS